MKHRIFAAPSLFAVLAVFFALMMGWIMWRTPAHIRHVPTSEFVRDAGKE